MENTKQYTIVNDVSLVLYVNDFKRHCTNFNRHMFGFIIGEDGGRILFTYWYEDENNKHQNVQWDIHINKIYRLEELTKLFRKDDLQNQFLNTANSYGGVKEFLKFQPNFKSYKKAIE